MDAISAFAAHVVECQYEHFGIPVVAAAKTAILDTLGVGLAGSAAAMAAVLADLQARSASVPEARVWGNGARLSAAAAALCNAYQVHNTEFDCLHEQAVVHAMTAVLPAAMAEAERRTGVSGRELIAAAVLGVDVAAGLGVAAKTGLRFFRPATAGAFGAAAAVGRLRGLDHAGMVHAFSIAYGQACGTMQAHAEGSSLLALQMGFNARNAVIACDLAAHGFTGPEHVLEGPYGYFRLFESAGEPQRVAAELGRRFFIVELAYKPFPSGRATHGILEACLTLRREHAIDAAAIDRISVRVPPLVQRLVGRPSRAQMDANYARLSAAYLAARALLMGAVDHEAFTPHAYSHTPTQELAKRVDIDVLDADANALTPVEVAIDLRSGTRYATRLDVVYGNPAKPIGAADRLAKFRRNCAAALRPPSPEATERLIAQLARLEDLEDVATLLAS